MCGNPQISFVLPLFNMKREERVNSNRTGSALQFDEHLWERGAVGQSGEWE